jgi:hypothetical protein
MYKALTLVTACAAAVPAVAQSSGLELELNKVEQTGSDCRVIFKSTNRLGVDLKGFGLEVYLLDPRGVALQSILLSFGSIGLSKGRFAKFDLKGRTCTDIGGVFVNEFKSCQADSDMPEKCRSSLSLKNLTSLSFTDGAAP